MQLLMNNANYLMASGIAMLTMIAVITPKWKERDPAGQKSHRKMLYFFAAISALSLVCGIVQRITDMSSIGMPTFGEFIYTVGLGVVVGAVATVLGFFVIFHERGQKKK